MVIDKSICPHCGSRNIHFNAIYGFYHCNACAQNWAFDEDDPDYYELPEEENYSDESREVGSVWGFRNTQTGETWDA